MSEISFIYKLSYCHRYLQACERRTYDTGLHDALPQCDDQFTTTFSPNIATPVPVCNHPESRLCKHT